MKIKSIDMAFVVCVIAMGVTALILATTFKYKPDAQIKITFSDTALSKMTITGKMEVVETRKYAGEFLTRRETIYYLISNNKKVEVPITQYLISKVGDEYTGHWR